MLKDYHLAYSILSPITILVDYGVRFTRCIPLFLHIINWFHALRLKLFYFLFLKKTSLIWLFFFCWRNLQDLPIKPKYLITFTVGYDQRYNIDAAIKKVIPISELPRLLTAYVCLCLLYICSLNDLWAYKIQFSENFTIVLFHYDGRVNEWDEFDWSKRVIHISVRKQTKWFVKKFS